MTSLTESERSLEHADPEIVRLVQKLGDIVRAKRQALGLTVRDVASVARVSKSYITRIEMGHILYPELVPFVAVTAVLNIPLDELREVIVRTHLGTAPVTLTPRPKPQSESMDGPGM